MKKSFKLVSLAMAVALGLGMTAVHAKTKPETLAAAAAAQIGLAEAISSAEKLVPGKVLKAELESKKRDAQGAPIYKLEVINGQGRTVDVTVSSADGKALSQKDDGPTSKKTQDRLASAKLTLADALNAALVHTAGKPLQIDLDSHFGTVVYEVDVLTATQQVVEVKVDAANGKVVTSKVKR